MTKQMRFCLLGGTWIPVGDLPPTINKTNKEILGSGKSCEESTAGQNDWGGAA